MRIKIRRCDSQQLYDCVIIFLIRTQKLHWEQTYTLLVTPQPFIFGINTVQSKTPHLPKSAILFSSHF